MIPEALASEFSSLQAAFAGDCRRCSPLDVDGVFSSTWFVQLVWIPVAFALTILKLRSSKAWLLAQEYEQRAREGRIVE